jgi:F0F1-type ATP synthase assembly protein I
MSNMLESEKAKSKQKILNLSLLFTTALVGLSTLAIILVALFLGIWLDKQYASEPAFTMGLLLASIPVSLLVMIFIVKALINKFRKMSDSISQEYS